MCRKHHKGMESKLDVSPEARDSTRKGLTYSARSSEFPPMGDSEHCYGQPKGDVLGSHGAIWFLQAVMTTLLLLGGDLGAFPCLEGKAA